MVPLRTLIPGEEHARDIRASDACRAQGRRKRQIKRKIDIDIDTEI